MRVTVVTDAWTPQVNGVVTTLTQTIAGLRRLGHEVSLISPDGFRTMPCPSEPTLRLAIFPRRRVARMLDEQRPEAIHIATEGPLGISARKICLRRGWRFTTSYCTRFPEYLKMRLRIPLIWTYAVVRRFHGASSCTMVSTDTMRDELAAKGFRNLGHWPRGVDTDLFHPREDRDALGAEPPIFTYMGRVAKEKNIEAFLRQDLPGTKCVIGDGPAMAALKTQYPDVMFLGMRHGEDLAGLLACGDVFVFPSLTDTFGLVMLEAMACGLPVAAFPVQGPLNVIQSGRTGIMSDDLRQACLQALDLDRNVCREYALEHSWDRVAEQFAANLVPIHD